MNYCFRVALHDTDAAGVMFFAHLLRHAHDAYEHWLANLGVDLCQLIAAGVALPIVHASADYLAPLRHGDAVEVAVSLADLSQRRFRLEYKFYSASQQLLARAQTVHVAIDPQQHRACPLPETLQHIFAELQASAANSRSVR